MTKVFPAASRGAPVLSFIIPVRDDAARLRTCLQSIAASAVGTLLEVVVVDNGSADASADVATMLGATVVRRPHASVAALRNAGAAVATGDFLAFVDADHAIGASWVRDAISAFATSEIAAAGSLCRAPADGTWVQKAYDRLRARGSGVRIVDWLGSGNLVVRRDVFDAVEGFDASLATCEDVDLCRRIRARGLLVVDDDRLVNIHFGDPATLSAVVRGERWRGRDNLRVSFRDRVTWRGAPSTSMPLIDLLLMAAAMAGIGSMTAAGVRAALLAVGGFVLLAAIRPARALARRGGGLLAFVQTLAVSCAYDLGRALALVLPDGYRARRAGSWR
jgi:hypothetical protein